ncbi:hypothetical protein CDL12_06195 [Handroanthus impetiginosus]|uniref:Pectinesterase inhibitor domain-containing protein n=1 Tax=Handroanthus impetiginosus TaxID=429701 RepID=A0A2G9HUA8_9LAMI|nr:hypothetical protein CDL12_06195 [Handroanthus impetiginosus]
MAPIKFNYLFLTSATLLLLFAAQCPSAEARKFIGVNPWCHTASYRRLCTRMVAGATTWQDASVNAMKSTLGLAKGLQGVVNLVKPAIASLSKTSQESIIATCIDDFEGIVDDLEKSLQSMKIQDIGTIRSRLSAALSGDCEEALSEFHIQSPISRYAKLLHKEVDNCLAVLLQI